MPTTLGMLPKCSLQMLRMHISRRFLKQITQHIHDPEQIDVVTHRYRTGQEPCVAWQYGITCPLCCAWSIAEARRSGFSGCQTPGQIFRENSSRFVMIWGYICIEKYMLHLQTIFILQVNQFFVTLEFKYLKCYCGSIDLVLWERPRMACIPRGRCSRWDRFGRPRSWRDAWSCTPLLADNARYQNWITHPHL